MELNNLNLASIIQDPNNLKTLLLNKEASEIGLSSLKLLAGTDINTKVDDIIEQVKQDAGKSINEYQ